MADTSAYNAALLEAEDHVRVQSQLVQNIHCLSGIVNLFTTEPQTILSSVPLDRSRRLKSARLGAGVLICRLTHLHPHQSRN